MFIAFSVNGSPEYLGPDALDEDTAPFLGAAEEVIWERYPDLQFAHPAPRMCDVFAPDNWSDEQAADAERWFGDEGCVKALDLVLQRRLGNIPPAGTATPVLSEGSSTMQLVMIHSTGAQSGEAAGWWIGEHRDGDPLVADDAVDGSLTKDDSEEAARFFGVRIVGEFDIDDERTAGYWDAGYLVEPTGDVFRGSYSLR